MNLPAPAPPRRLPQNKRRGFTLIEIAIAMVVIGVLLGAVVPTMRALEERRQFKNENSRMETIRDAIVGYAIRNRTRARTIEVVPFYRRTLAPDFTLPSWTFHLPAGRPYLPCPDWDGDGYEDRSPEGQNGFVQGIEVRPNLTVTATVTKGRNPRGDHPHLFWTRPLTENSHVPSQPHGNCVVSRGAVPWRTLGVHPADHWGNRHTYYADPVFSNSIFGFDRQTIADILDRRVPESPGYFRSPRIGSRAEYGGRSADGRRTIADVSHCPAVICNGVHAGNCWQHEFFRNSFSEIPYCTWGTAPPATPNSSPAPYASLVLKAGAMTKEAWHNGRETFPPGSVTDGLPFVLVSHGPNGRYAVNHWATLRNPTDENGNRTPICNWGNSEDALVVSPDDRGRIHEAVNGSRTAPAQFYPSLPTERCPQINRSILNPSFFVWEPPSDEFDDLLLWITREELTTSISGNIPKLPTMSIPYFDFD